MRSWRSSLYATLYATLRGADWIRSRNLNTRLADENCGPRWLDRDEPDHRY